MRPWYKTHRLICLLGVLNMSMLANAQAPSSTKLLLGTWDGTDTASMSIYRYLSITQNSIAWPRTHNLAKCKTSYRVIAQSQGKTYPDQLDGSSSNASQTDATEVTYNTIKIKLTPKKCTGRIGYLQFSSTAEDSHYATVIEYDQHNKATGWMHFQKRK